VSVSEVRRFAYLMAAVTGMLSGRGWMVFDRGKTLYIAAHPDYLYARSRPISTSDLMAPHLSGWLPWDRYVRPDEAPTFPIDLTVA
jgi:hypothetical protein